MSQIVPNHNNHNAFFPRDLFRVYKVQRFLLAELVLILSAAWLTPWFEAGFNEAKIKTFGQGVWWALVTATNTGYGDLVPVSLGGKTIATVLMFSGFALYSVAVGSFIMFVNRHQSRRNWQKTHLHLEEIGRKLERLEKQQEFLIKSQAK